MKSKKNKSSKQLKILERQYQRIQEEQSLLSMLSEGLLFGSLAFEQVMLAMKFNEAKLQILKEVLRVARTSR